MDKPLHVIIDKPEESSPQDLLAFLFIALLIGGATVLFNFEKYDTWAIISIILGVLGIIWRIKSHLS